MVEAMNSNLNVVRADDGRMVIGRPIEELSTTLSMLLDYMQDLVREDPDVWEVAVEIKRRTNYAPDGGNLPLKDSPAESASAAAWRAAMNRQATWQPVTTVAPGTSEVPIQTPVPGKRPVKDNPQA
jgi:hypothetical protein